MLGMLETAATILGGVVSTIAIGGAVVDVITNGWVRARWRRWNGYDSLHRDHQVTQAFINDLGNGFNELTETVCEHLEIPEPDRPDGVDVEQYERLMDPQQGVEPGDFRGSDD